MVRYWLAGAAALALTTNFAAAQTSSSSSDTTITTRPGYVAPAPAPNQSYTETRQQRTFDANGVETTKTEHMEKSQTLNSGDGSLSSETHIRTGETTTVQPPAPPVTIYRSQTTTTTEK